MGKMPQRIAELEKEVLELRTLNNELRGHQQYAVRLEAELEQRDGQIMLLTERQNRLEQGSARDVYDVADSAAYRTLATRDSLTLQPIQDCDGRRLSGCEPSPLQSRQRRASVSTQSTVSYHSSEPSHYNRPQLSPQHSHLRNMPLPPLCTFAGAEEGNEDDFDRWLRKFKCFAELGHWTDEEKLARLELYMVGRAERMHASMRFYKKSARSHSTVR